MFTNLHTKGPMVYDRLRNWKYLDLRNWKRFRIFSMFCVIFTKMKGFFGLKKFEGVQHKQGKHSCNYIHLQVDNKKQLIP